MLGAWLPGKSLYWRSYQAKSICSERETESDVGCQFLFAFVSEKKNRWFKADSFELLRMAGLALSLPGSLQGSGWCHTSGLGLR